MEQRDIFGETTEKKMCRLERQLIRMQQELWYLKETYNMQQELRELKEKSGKNPPPNSPKIHQLDLFAGTS